MFEHKSEPLLPQWAFFGRMAQSGAIVAGIITFSLFVGSAGYHYLGGLPWIHMEISEDARRPPKTGS
jgi:hypothetical protein